MFGSLRNLFDSVVAAARGGVDRLARLVADGWGRVTSAAMRLIMKIVASVRRLRQRLSERRRAAARERLLRHVGDLVGHLEELPEAA